MNPSFITVIVSLSFAILAVILACIVISRKIQLRGLVEVGLGMISLGLCLASISLFEVSDYPIDEERLMQLVLIGGGTIALIFAIISKRKGHLLRRRDDWLEPGTQRAQVTDSAHKKR